jgi:hypothetical protein
LLPSKTPPPTNVGKDAEEKGALIHCWWECRLVQPLWKTIWRFLENLDIDPPYNTTIPLPGIYQKECDSGSYKDS